MVLALVSGTSKIFVQDGHENQVGIVGSRKRAATPEVRPENCMIVYRYCYSSSTVIMTAAAYPLDLAMSEEGFSMPRRKKPTIQHAEIVRGFAERLREVRRARGMTQAELARQATISESYLWRLEAAGAACGIDLLDRLATALGTTPPALLPTPGPPAEIAVLREQVRRQVKSLLQTEDRQTLGLLAQFLACLSETTPRTSA